LTIVVAGSARKSGKTTAVCEIVAATRDAHWTAIKMTPHAHGADLRNPVVVEERKAGSETDTARYLSAGAHHAFWVRCSPRDIERALIPLLSGNVIIESNSVVGTVPADLVILIGLGDQIAWKTSALQAAALADVVVERITEDTISRVRSLLSEQRR
jgi:molybdopterin-guanine dinucleotide biosynthesis protein